MNCFFMQSKAYFEILHLPLQVHICLYSSFPKHHEEQRGALRKVTSFMSQI